MQYDSPVSVEEVKNLFVNNDLAPATIESIDKLISINGNDSNIDVGYAGVTEVGMFDLPPPPSGDGSYELLILDTSGLAPALDGAPIPVVLPPPAAQAPLFVIQGNVGLELAFNTVERVIVTGQGNDNITVNGDRNTTIESGGGNDTLNTSGGDDYIVSSSGNASIATGAGSDTIVTGQGNDTIDSGTGFDKVLVNFSGANATVTKSDNGLVVANGDSNNAITLLNTNFIEFSTGESFTVSNSLEAATAMRLYDTLLERAAEFGGAQYWTNLVEQGASLTDIAVGFATSAEFIQKHGNVFEFETDAFVEKMYDLMLGRGSDEAGKAYWADLVNQGTVQRGDMIVFFADSAEAVETYQDTVKFIDDWLL